MKLFIALTFALVLSNPVQAQELSSTALTAQLLRNAYDEMQTFAARSILTASNGVTVPSGRMCSGHRPHIDELTSAMSELRAAAGALTHKELLKNISWMGTQVGRLKTFCRAQAVWEGNPSAAMTTAKAVRAMSFRGMKLVDAWEAELNTAVAEPKVETADAVKQVESQEPVVSKPDPDTSVPTAK